MTAPSQRVIGDADVYVRTCNKETQTKSAQVELKITSVNGVHTSLLGGREITINGFVSETGRDAREKPIVKWRYSVRDNLGAKEQNHLHHR